MKEQLGATEAAMPPAPQKEVHAEAPLGPIISSESKDADENMGPDTTKKPASRGSLWSIGAQYQLLDSVCVGYKLNLHESNARCALL